MPILDWIGKRAVENHHLEIPFKMLKCEADLSVGDIDSGNLIIQGDNLEALKALLPYYSQKIKCICIDPPYNTGNEKWVYNDNVNSPEIKEWLAKTVGKEGEDLSRHDKWLCMMYPRIQLLRKFLTRDGVIFINIDENEISNLLQICDEIFGANRIGIFIWESRSGKGGTVKNLAVQHEYILAYALNKENVILKPDVKIFQGGNYEDEIGTYKREQLRQWGQGDKREDRPSMFFPIKNYEGKDIYPIKTDGTEGRWRCSIKTANKLKEDGNLDFVNENGVITVYKKIRSGKINKSVFGTLLYNLGSASTGTIELKEMFGEKLFPTVKPTNLIKYLIDLVTYDNKNSIILDSFAGSGTTAHSVLKLNSEDNGNRRFILIEMDEKICNEITRERINKIVNGYYIKKKNKIIKIDKINSGYKFCTLANNLFDKHGNINLNVKYRDLAYHIFFSETGTPLSQNAKIEKTPLIEIFKDTAYYLLFNGILGDKSLNGGNVLTSSVLEKLPKYNGKKIIFGEGCRLSSYRLKRENIVFKQIPYEIKVK